jgi:hypothetical protein
MIAKSVLLLLILSVCGGLILSAVSLLNKETVQMEDFAAVRYGFPYYYVEHMLVSFSGSVDRWAFSGVNFVVNVGLYFLLSVGVWSAILLLRNRRRASLC